VTGWIRPGRLGAVEIALIIAFSVVSSVALVLWVHLIEPDLTDVTERIPAWHPALLALLGLAFACMNALGEEIIWRGIMQDALEAGLGPGIAAMIVQGLSFGLFHINGFPRGLVGVGLATFYGVMMGILRMRSRGLLAPWIAHVCADATIFAIMAFWLTGPGSTPTED